MDERIITASHGCMLTNGEIYASSVRLGDWDSADNWQEVPVSQYEKAMSEQTKTEEIT